MKRINEYDLRRLNGCEFRIPPKIEDDVHKLFKFEKGARHQDRCHDYCEKRKILRDFNTPATLAAVRDLAGRAYNSGRVDMANEIIRRSVKRRRKGKRAI